MGKIEKPNKTELKKDFAQYKREFLTAVKDKKRWLYCLIEVAIAGVLLAVDLLLKHFLYGHCVTQGDIVIIDGVIRFTAVRNTGASFGIFSNHTTALTVVSLICAILLIGFIFYSYPRRNKWLRSALIMISAGALGNVIDRLALGYVRDYVYFELIDFAVFNFADSCLCIGTAVLIIYLLFFYTKEEKAIAEKKANAALSERINTLIEEADDGETELKETNNGETELKEENTDVLAVEPVNGNGGAEVTDENGKEDTQDGSEN